MQIVEMDETLSMKRRIWEMKRKGGADQTPAVVKCTGDLPVSFRILTCSDLSLALLHSPLFLDLLYLNIVCLI